MSILYVDDDLDDREIFMDALGRICPEVICYAASDGVEGLAMLQNLPDLPDVIFLDVNMPRMNAKEFLLAREKIAAFSSIPVFIYSTSTNTSEHLDYVGMGAKGFLVKDTSFSRICATISEALNSIGTFSR